MYFGLINEKKSLSHVENFSSQSVNKSVSQMLSKQNFAKDIIGNSTNFEFKKGALTEYDR